MIIVEKAKEAGAKIKEKAKNFDWSKLMLPALLLSLIVPAAAAAISAGIETNESKKDHEAYRDYIDAQANLANAKADKARNESDKTDDE